jgi:hypothetical protein
MTFFLPLFVIKMLIWPAGWQSCQTLLFKPQLAKKTSGTRE